MIPANSKERTVGLQSSLGQIWVALREGAGTWFRKATHNTLDEIYEALAQFRDEFDDQYFQIKAIDQTGRTVAAFAFPHGKPIEICDGMLMTANGRRSGHKGCTWIAGPFSVRS